MQFFVNGAPVCGDVLPLGVQGEALTTTVTADVSDWLEQWPGGQVIVQVISPGQTQTRIANTVVQEGVLTWLVTSEDTVTPGFGAGVVKLIQGQQVKKSAPFITQVVGEPNDESSAQETVPGWVDEAIRQMQQLELDTDLSAQAAQTAQTAAEAARDAAQTAQTAAETASGSASESAQTAQTAAAAAGESADAAQTAKTAAEAAAQTAGTAAETASGSAQQAQTAAAAAGESASAAQTAQTAAEAAQADAAASAAQAAQSATDAQTAAESAQQAVAGAVKYSEAQTLTAAQQAQARANIGAASGDAPAAPPIIASAGPADIVSVTDGAEDAPVKSLAVNIEPVQAGSGDPSPDNVRPISGWTALNIVVSPTTDAEDGAAYPVTLPAEAGTVYGGTLTINSDGSGELVVDHVRHTLPTGNYTKLGNTDGAVFTRNRNNVWDERPVGLNSGGIVLADKLLPVEQLSASAYTPYSVCIYNAANNYIRVGLPNDVVSTPEELSEWLTNNPVVVVYQIATPVTYSLTAPQVRTLLGVNNIWADAGPVSAEYTADTKMYIDSQTRATRSLIAGIETDLTASRAYAAGDLLIVGDTLYKAAASIASGATLTPGTNVTPTTVAEQLILLANA